MLRVGELVRHALAQLFARGEIEDDALVGAVITVPEVRMSPDLKLASAYVMPLGGERAPRSSRRSTATSASSAAASRPRSISNSRPKSASSSTRPSRSSARSTRCCSPTACSATSTPTSDDDKDSD